jgi:diacylglycerol kinase
MFLKDAIDHLILKFKHAFAGVVGGIGHDRSLRFHYAIALVVIILFAYLRVGVIEYSLTLLGIGLIISLEYLNSALELLCDHVHAEYHATIKKIKDFGAAAVLVSSVTVGIMGLLILVKTLQ